MGIIMASEKRRKKSPLADCTNTTNLSRPRRSCCSYASPPTARQNSIIQSPQPNNPLIDPKYPLTRSGNNQNQNEDIVKVKSNCPTSTTVVPGVRNYQIPQCAQDISQIKGVYSEHREREGTSLQTTSSCPTLGRGSLKSKQKTAKSTEPENQSKTFEDSLAVGGGSHDEIKKCLRVDINDKENLTTPESVLPALYNFQFLESHEDTGRRNTRVYSKRRERECSSSDSEEVSLNCALGRAVIESKQKAGRSHEAKNCSKNLADSPTAGIDNHDQNELSSNDNFICKENLSTPQPCVAAIDSFQFPDENVDFNFENIRVQSMLQGSKNRAFEKVSLSCPPLGRSVLKRHTGERCAELWKYSSLGARDDSPVSGDPKMKAQRKGKSLPVNKRKNTLPEKFVQEQRAHFAEIDAFALEEEE